MKVSNAMRVALALKAHGVNYLFGQSNPFSITLACEELGIEQIGYRQENAGAYMAQGYAMCTNKVPVVTAQNGPAATLLVPGLAEALKSSYPMVALVDEISSNFEEKNAFQELDQVALFQGVSKWVKRIPSADRIEDYINRAFLIASSGRPGPVVLLCPKDLMLAESEIPNEDYKKQNYGSFPLDRFVPTTDKIQEVVSLIQNANHPIIFAGGGAVSSNAHEEIRSLQEKFHIPVATTTMGKGIIDESHPLSIGPIGYYMGKRGSTKFLKEFIQSSDLIILVGNRTNQNGTDSWTILPEEATYIQIDIDPTEVERNYSGVRIVGDAKATLAQLNEALSKTTLTKRTQKRKEIEQIILENRTNHQAELQEVLKDDIQEIKVERFLYELESYLSDDHILVADASLSSVWLANFTKATGLRKFLFPRGLAGLGWGLPYAMGASIANPNQTIFCLVGDGGFAHVWSELETCKRLNLNIVLVVINNRSLAYQKLTELSVMGKHTNICELNDVQHTLIAEACGIKAIRIDKPSQIRETLNDCMNQQGMFVIELMTNSNDLPPVKILENVEFSTI